MLLSFDRNKTVTAQAAFLAGTFASNVGNGMHTLTVGLLLYEKTGTIAAFGLVIVVEQALTLLMQVVAGPWVDRGDPRRVAVAAEALRGALVCTLSLVLIAVGHSTLGLILGMTVVIRVLHPFHRAGTFALTPMLVLSGDLARLNSWFSAAQQGGQLVGLGAAGFIIAQLGLPAVFLINGVTFLVSAASLLALPAAPTARAAPLAAGFGSHLGDLVSSWHEVFDLLRKQPHLVGLIVVSTADNVALTLFNLILAPFAAERLAGSAEAISLAAGAFAFGALAAAALVTTAKRALGSQKAIQLALAGQAAGFVLLAFAWQPAAISVVAFFVGACNTISWTVAISVVQHAAPARVRGRVAMLRNGVTALLVAPMVPVISYAVDTHSVAASVLAAAAVCALFVMFAALTGKHRPPGEIAPQPQAPAA